jgi:hypothetical protein
VNSDQNGWWTDSENSEVTPLHHPGDVEQAARLAWNAAQEERRRQQEFAQAQINAERNESHQSGPEIHLQQKGMPGIPLTPHTWYSPGNEAQGPPVIQGELTDAIALSVLRGELYYPLRKLEMSVDTDMLDPKSPLSGMLSTSHVRLSLEQREGQKFYRWIKGWRRMSIALISVVYLGALIIEASLPTLFLGQKGYLREESLWILIALLVGFSMGLMVQKVVSYGPRHWLRLCYLFVTNGEYRKALKERVLSPSDSGKSSKGLLYRSFRVASVTLIVLIFLALILIFQLGFSIMFSK